MKTLSKSKIGRMTLTLEQENHRLRLAIDGPDQHRLSMPVTADLLGALLDAAKSVEDEVSMDPPTTPDGAGVDE